MKSTLSPEEAREKLERSGTTVADWARAHKVDQDIAYRVLKGRLKGRSGEAHKIAVLLGIKEGEIVEKRPASSARKAVRAGA